MSNDREVILNVTIDDVPVRVVRIVGSELYLEGWDIIDPLSPDETRAVAKRLMDAADEAEGDRCDPIRAETGICSPDDSPRDWKAHGPYNRDNLPFEVASPSTGRTICRTWSEHDAETIADALNSNPNRKD